MLIKDWRPCNIGSFTLGQLLDFYTSAENQRKKVYCAFAALPPNNAESCVCVCVCVCPKYQNVVVKSPLASNTSICHSRTRLPVAWHQARPSNFLTIESTAGGRALNFAAGGISFNLHGVTS